MGIRDEFFFGMGDSERRCYLRVLRLREAVQSPKVLDALMATLEVPGKPNVKQRLSDDEKFQAICDQIEHFRRAKTSLWHDNKAGEILAASIWRSRKLADKFVEQLFCGVRYEEDLQAPVARWLHSQGFEVHEEISMGKKRSDLLGHRPPAWAGLRGRALVAIELKNDLKEFERAIDQMTTYTDYSHRVYLACVPALAAGYLVAHSESRGVHHWDADVLDRKLKKLGLGLMLVEGNDVFVHIEPRLNEVASNKTDEVLALLTSKTRVNVK